MLRLTKQEVITNLKGKTCHECAWWGYVLQECVFPHNGKNHESKEVLRHSKMDVMNVNLGCDDWCKEIDLWSLRGSIQSRAIEAYKAYLEPPTLWNLVPPNKKKATNGTR
jgi:hypothetical protein